MASERLCAALPFLGPGDMRALRAVSQPLRRCLDSDLALALLLNSSHQPTALHQQHFQAICISSRSYVSESLPTEVADVLSKYCTVNKHIPPSTTSSISDMPTDDRRCFQNQIILFSSESERGSSNNSSCSSGPDARPSLSSISSATSSNSTTTTGPDPSTMTQRLPVSAGIGIFNLPAGYRRPRPMLCLFSDNISAASMLGDVRSSRVDCESVGFPISSGQEIAVGQESRGGYVSVFAASKLSRDGEFFVRKRRLRLAEDATIRYFILINSKTSIAVESSEASFAHRSISTEAMDLGAVGGSNYCSNLNARLRGCRKSKSYRSGSRQEEGPSKKGAFSARELTACLRSDCRISLGPSSASYSSASDELALRPSGQMKRCKSLFNISKLVSDEPNKMSGGNYSNETASISPCYRRQRNRGYSCDDIDAASALRGGPRGSCYAIVESDLSEDDDSDYAFYSYSGCETDSTASSEGSSGKESATWSRRSLLSRGPTNKR